MNDELIPALKKTLAYTGALDTKTLKMVAEQMGLPLSRVAGVATFYSDLTGAHDGEVDLRFAEGELAIPVAYEQAAAMAKSGEVLERLKGSGIRGRGGAGFPVASKWEISAHVKSDEKYVVCNCSEGEPGTFKDLKLMLKAPHAILEGMFLCAAAVGANRGIICVRSEYPEARSAMEKAVEDAKRYWDGFTLSVFSGAGSYVCGEETALLRCLEGYRGEPALKPPYPGIAGLDGKPTVINNAESFAAVACYLLHGQQIKLYTVSGAVAHPGVYCLLPQTTVGELARLAGADAGCKGFQVGGGATGSIYGIDQLGISADSGTASVIFFGGTADIRRHCLESIEFLARQSCGKCTPCRFGLQELSRGLEDGLGADALAELCRYIELNARCAFGQAAPVSVASALKAFPDAF